MHHCPMLWPACLTARVLCQDTELSFKRWDFLALRSYDEVLALMQRGKAFAGREAAAGKLQAFEPLRRQPAGR